MKYTYFFIISALIPSLSETMDLRKSSAANIVVRNPLLDKKDKIILLSKNPLESDKTQKNTDRPYSPRKQRAMKRKPLRFATV